MSAWKNQKRAEKEAAWREKMIADEQERARKESLSMMERIDEAETMDDVKDILSRMAEHIGLGSYD